MLPVLGKRPLSVSLSRADDVVVVDVSECGAVGIDVELLYGASFSRFAVALHPDEVATTVEERATTLVGKESLSKATGDGLHLDPRLIRLSGPGQPPRLIEWSVTDPPVPDVDAGSRARRLRSGVTVLRDSAPRPVVRVAVREALPR